MGGVKRGTLSTGQKTLLFLLLMAASVLFGLLAYESAWHRSALAPSRQSPSQTTEPIVAMPMELARQQAAVWSSDALLSEAKELAGEWRFLFVSATKKGLGYQVTIDANLQVEGKEIPFVGVGGTVPANSISREMAIAKMHQITGYEQAKVLGAEIVYGPDGKQWYWGVKTNLGVVTIPAK